MQTGGGILPPPPEPPSVNLQHNSESASNAQTTTNATSPTSTTTTATAAAGMTNDSILSLLSGDDTDGGIWSNIDTVKESDLQKIQVPAELLHQNDEEEVRVMYKNWHITCTLQRITHKNGINTHGHVETRQLP